MLGTHDMVPRRPRSSRCVEAPERVLGYYDDASSKEPSPEPEKKELSPEPPEEKELSPEPEDEEPEPLLGGKAVAIVDVGSSNKDFVTAAIGAGGEHAIADEIWAIDEMAGILMHHRAFSLRPLECRSTWKWLKDHPGPLYCSSDPELYPGCVAYPLGEALEILGVGYLTSSSAYALAFAMIRGVKTVKLYGVDALEARPCMEYLICKALHRGISVQISAGSSLMNSSTKPEDKLYGFCERQDPPIPRMVDDRLTVVSRSQLGS
jgi:hypothetical protein